MQSDTKRKRQRPRTVNIDDVFFTQREETRLEKLAKQREASRKHALRVRLAQVYQERQMKKAATDGNR